MFASTTSGAITPHILIEEEEYIIVSVDSADIYHIQTADIDRDNYLDLIYTGSVESGLFAAYGSESDTLETPVSLLSINQAAVAVDYIDSDTLLDIAAVDASNLYILLNQGNRSFNTSTISLSPKRQEIPAIYTGYFDDDLDIDLAIAPDKIYYGNGIGGFPSNSTLSFNFETVNAYLF